MSQPTSQTGCFIVFEGIDGAGTTTQAALLHTRLTGAGLRSHKTAEPSTGPVGRLLRSLLAGTDAPFDPTAMALLFAADRRDHLAREILPLLAAGTHVICDRYVLSSLVYQTAAGVPRPLVAAANDGARRPDLTLLLTVPAAVAAARRARRGGPADLYETDETQRAVAAAYEAEAAALQAQGAPVRVLRGDLPVEEVETAIWQALDSCLGPLLRAGST